MMRTVVYGKRICQRCKGICHERSYRERYGWRKKYWCSWDCLCRDKIWVREENKVEYFQSVRVVAK
jgi:hypothetical protein